MSDISQGEGWWLASDGKWYAPELHPNYVAPIPTSPYPAPPVQPGPTFVPPAASTQQYTAVPGFQPQPAYAQPQPGYGTPQTPVPVSSKNRRNVILGLGALVLVAGLGFLAFRVFGGSGGGTGADSPEAALDQLFTSTVEADRVGFVEIFDPDEIDAWFGSFSPTLTTLEGAETQPNPDDPSQAVREIYTTLFEAIDVAVTGPGGEAIAYEVEPLGDEGNLARVRVSGLDIAMTSTAEVPALIVAFAGQPSATDLGVLGDIRLEIRDERRGIDVRSFVEGEPNETDFVEDLHLDLVTVRKDGKWYVSIGYTILELARSQDGFGSFVEPDFGRALRLVEEQTGGSTSAEDVVRDFATALEGLDYDTMIRLTDPVSLPYLHDYQPLIDDQADDFDRREAAREVGLRFDELELELSEWEGRTVVRFDRISGEVGGTGSFEFDAQTWCGRASDEFDETSGCLEDIIGEFLSELDRTDDPAEFLPEQVGFVVVERNGRWFLDPLGTVGFLSDQVSEASAGLLDDLNAESNPLSEQLLFVQGPVARQGQPATATAEAGQLGIALDLSAYPTVRDEFDEVHVAAVRLSGTGDLLSRYGELTPIQDNEWIVAFDDVDNGQRDKALTLPAVAALTDGSVTAELFEIQVTEVGIDGFSGQLGAEGRPQIFTFTDEATAYDIIIEGAGSVSYWSYETPGTSLDNELNDPGSFAYVGGSLLTVVKGEPGAPFTIRIDIPVVDPPEPEPEPDPEPLPDEPFDLGDPNATAFAAYVEGFNYTYDSEQSGGFFDGCGPDDPDVVSYLFESPKDDVVLITPYPSAERAQDAFDALLTVASPCEAFESIIVTSVEPIGSDAVRITWEFEGEDPVVEHYRLVGDVIVVATGSIDAVEAQLEFLDEW